MLNLRTLILGQPRTCPQTGLQNEPRYSEKPSEFGTVNWTPYLLAKKAKPNKKSPPMIPEASSFESFIVFFDKIYCMKIIRKKIKQYSKL